MYNKCLLLLTLSFPSMKIEISSLLFWFFVNENYLVTSNSFYSMKSNLVYSNKLTVTIIYVINITGKFKQ